LPNFDSTLLDLLGEYRLLCASTQASRLPSDHTMPHHIVGREDLKNGEAGEEWIYEAALYALRLSCLQ